MIKHIKNNINELLSLTCSDGESLNIPDLRLKAAHLGITALDFPYKKEGASISMQNMAEIFAFCGEKDLNLRDLPGLGHGRLITYSQSINKEQMNLLERTSKGLEFFAVAITEPQGGSDLHGLQTTATQSEKGYVIAGHKKYIARLSQASQLITFTRIANGINENKLAAFIIPMNVDSIKTTDLNSMGLKGCSFGGIEFKNTFVPLEFCLDSPDTGFAIFSEHFSYWRTAMAAAAIGCARGAVKQAISWLTNRNVFNDAIGRFTHLQQELSQHVARLRMGWSLVMSAMKLIEEGGSSYIQAAMAKAEAIEIAIEAVEWTMRIHGAKGYTTEMDLEKRLRDLLGLRIADGTTDVLRGQVARGLLGDEIYEKSLGRNRSCHQPHPILIEDLLYN